MKVQSVKSLSMASQYLRLCVYGEPGTGKTWFGASGALDPLTAPVWFVDYRSQIQSLRSNPKFMEAIEDKRLVITTLEDYGDLDYVYTYLFRGPGSVPILDKVFGEENFPKTLVIDSTTELQRSEVMLKAGNPVDKFIRNVERPEIQHWGSLLNQFTLLAHLYYDLPMHVVFQGLEAVDYGHRTIGEAPRVVGRRLALQGQAQRQFPAYALTLMRLDRAARNVKPPAFNIGYTQAVTSKTKEQTGMIPAVIVNPTLPKLAAYLRGKESNVTSTKATS